MSTEVTFIVSLLQELSSELCFELLVEPEYGYAGRIKTKKGKIFYFHSTHFDINPLGASEIAADKAYASYFMRRLNYSTPEGCSFYSDQWCKKICSKRNSEAAVEYAKTLGYPVIVKPNSQSQGIGVEKVFSKQELRRAIDTIFKKIGDKVLLVQRIVEGNDYRIVVLDGEVLCAYRRVPLSIVGNGKSTVQELFQKKQVEFVRRGRDTTLSLDDPRMHRKLHHLGMDLTTVVAKGAHVLLLDNANLSSGGDAEDVTRDIHNDYRNMAIKLAHDMGLRFCGIDFMTSQPISEELRSYTVIEINAAPGLDYYAEGGEAQKEIVRNLYRKMLKYMINN